jgi:DNA (cytosine-5)-methyltransferase 1
MTAYYNEHDPYAAAWLRNLIHAGHIAPGIVDERSIEDVFPSDLRGFTQCHFFAGVGVWSYAARRAGWADDRPLWTGSCPCQPFSAAGKGLGVDDERHLWPALHHLIAQCRPPVVVGEQVASKDGLAWLDAVLADLEDSDYAAGAVDTCSAGFGAPHIRQRLYWLAHAAGERQHGRKDPAGPPGRHRAQDRSEARGMADADGGHAGAEGLQRRGQHGQQPQDGGIAVEGGEPGPVNGFWRAADWLGCTDGFWRPVEPGAFPLADGVASRVGKLRAFGNAINADQARVFLECVMEIL